MLADSAPEDNHARLLCVNAHVVEPADVTDDVDVERRRVRLVGVEVHHVAEGAISKSWAEHRDVVLFVSLVPLYLTL